MRALFAFLLLCVGGGLSPLAWAQDSTASQTPDVRMIFDVSGSMKANDPANLRASALQLAATLLPSQTRGSVWTFGSQVRNPLPDGKVDAQWRRRARSLAPQLVDYQQFTDIEGVLRDATDTPGGKRHVVLLTDGMVDLPGSGEGKRTRDTASRETLLTSLAPELASRDVVVHTIALSHNVDRELLERISQATGGLAAVAETPEALLRAFLDVLERIVPSDQLPLEKGSFDVDDEVEGFNALLFHDEDAPELALVGPDGERYTRDDHPDDMLWQSNPRYDLIRVPEPQVGEWHIEGPVGRDSRVSIESPLQLRSDTLPPTLYLGFEVPIDAWLVRDGDILKGDTLPEDVRLRGALRGLDDETLASTSLKADNDGHFTGTLAAPEEAGNARLVLNADSDSWQRERVQGVNVVTPVSATLNDDATQVTLEAQHPRLNVDNTQISANLLGETLDVVPDGERTWQVALPEIDPEQSVPLDLDVSVTLDDRTWSIALPALRLNPEARIGVSGADVDGDGPRAEALPDDATAATQDDESDAREESSLTVLASALWDKAGDEWQALRPHVEPYAKRPTTWAVFAALLLALVLLWRLRRRSRRRHHRRRHEPQV
ncbi:VWA domain-containing protein [Chromohalobacter sp. TMW 2.2308]|uniref:VWA domain-containing protein n=1 Tax=Chromohalobacter TaxID=42054 RepID=UPI001FFC3279|nr:MULTISPECIES: vWA domain-containing protein [Chromohalobacter]MCK2041958.1 VWA domain-containing protein [Chromohalobacter moromii]MCT8514106.1 VWA domain-containing protein [Chromohalobacter sp. TMW 2.2271]